MLPWSLIVLTFEPIHDVGSRMSRHSGRIVDKLLVLAGQGDLAEVQSFFDKNGDVNIQGPSRQTVLMCASKYNRLDVMQLLIDANADLETADATDNTALTYATVSGSVDGMKLLLHAKANPNSPASMFTPRVERNNIELMLVQLLIDAKADINTPRPRQAAKSDHILTLTPLIASTERESNGTTVALLATGVADLSNKSVLRWAAHHSNTAAAQALIDAHASLTHKANNGSNALARATIGGHRAVMQVLLDAKASVETDLKALCTATGNNVKAKAPPQPLVLESDLKVPATALVAALTRKNVSAVRLLLEAKASVGRAYYGPCCDEASKGGEFSMKLLRHAIECLIEDYTPQVATPIIRTLMEAGAPMLDVVDEKWFQDADTKDKVSMMTLMLDSNVFADLDVKIRGETLLHKVLPDPDGRLINLLIQNKASPDIGDACGDTPLMRACFMTGQACSGARPNSPAEMHWLSTMTHLIEAKASLDLRDITCKTPLMHAVVGYWSGHCRIASLLIDAKASLDISDASGNTALHLAILGRNEKQASVLIEANANVNAKNHDGLTPLMAILQQPQPEELVVLLLNANASAVEQDNCGKTALMCAMGSRSPCQAWLVHTLLTHACVHESDKMISEFESRVEGFTASGQRESQSEESADNEPLVKRPRQC